MSECVQICEIVMEEKYVVEIDNQVVLVNEVGENVIHK